MTLHWSPAPAAGAEMAGDPLLPPISPSRLRPWKAPKKESSFAGAGFLAVVVCCTRKRGWWLLNMFTDEQKSLSLLWFYCSRTLGRQWWLLKWVFLTVLSAFFLARMACCRFLWQSAQSKIRNDTRASSLFMWGAALSSLSQVCLAKSLSWTTRQVTEYFITLRKVWTQLKIIRLTKKTSDFFLAMNGYVWIRSCEPPYLSLFSSSWYIRSQESGTFWLLQGRLLLLLTLCRRVKLLLRTDWLFLAPLLVEGFFPDTQLVNCFRESISRVVPRRWVSVVYRVVFPRLCDRKSQDVSVQSCMQDKKPVLLPFF